MASLVEGTATVGDGRSERQSAGVKDSQLSARLAGVPQLFLELLPQWLAIDASLSFKTVWKTSVVVLSRYTDSRGLRILCQEHPLFQSGQMSGLAFQAP